MYKSLQRLLDKNDDKKIHWNEIVVGLAMCGKIISHERAYKLVEGYVIPGGAMDRFHYLQWVMSAKEDDEVRMSHLASGGGGSNILELQNQVQRFVMYWPRNIIILIGPPGSGKGECMYMYTWI